MRVTCKTRITLDAFISAFGRIYLSHRDFNPSQITVLNFRHLVFQSCIKVNHIPPNWSFYNAAYLRCAFRRHYLLALCISMPPQRVADAANPHPYPFGQEWPPLENLERNGEPKKSRPRTVDKRKKLDLILVLGTRAAFCCSTRSVPAHIFGNLMMMKDMFHSFCIIF